MNTSTLDETLDFPTIKKVNVVGLHGVSDIKQEFKPGLNIVHAKNGDGKTTLLHIIANILEGQLDQFQFLQFREISMTANDGFELKLIPESDGIRILADDEPMETVNDVVLPSPPIRKLIHSHFGGRPVYLPAFRMILEALNKVEQRAYRASLPDRHTDNYNRVFHRELNELRENARETISTRFSDDLRERASSIAYKTVQCREWFGKFTPIVRFPSLSEVENQMNEELTQAQLSLGAFDRTSFSNVFSKIIDVIVGHSQEVPSRSYCLGSAVNGIC